MTAHKPVLSVVVTSRNDNHGGDLTRRTQIFVDALFAQSEKHRLNTELVFVEWNPPVDRLPIQSEISWPESDFCRARIVRVPGDEHKRIENSDNLPLFQMIGKNVGIRRATGRFVLSTNVDLIFSDGLFDRLVNSSIRDDAIYLASRYDVPAEIPETGEIGELLQFCENNVLRENLAAGLFDRTTGKWQWRNEPKFVRLWKIANQLAINYAWTVLDWIRLFGGSDGGRKMNRDYLHLELRREWVSKLSQLHTNACGDFTLASKEVWCRLRGYPELPYFSMHLDSLFLLVAAHAGVVQYSFPTSAPVFHIEHGSGWSFEGEAEMNKRIDNRNVPRLTFDQLREIDFDLASGRKHTFSDDNWGLSLAELREVSIERGISSELNSASKG